MNARAVVNYVSAGVLALMGGVYLWHGDYADSLVWIVLAVAFVGAGVIQNPLRKHREIWTRLMYGATLLAAAAFVFQAVNGFLK